MAEYELHPKRPDIGPLRATCDHKDCKGESKWQVGLILCAPKPYTGTLQAELNLVLCDEHAKTAKVEDFVDDAGWEKFCAGIRAAGKMLPDRKLTRLNLLPVLRTEVK